MTPQEIILIAQLAVSFGREVAAAWAAIYAKSKAGEPVTAEEVAAWLNSVDYDALVPNSAALNKPTI